MIPVETFPHFAVVVASLVGTVDRQRSYAAKFEFGLNLVVDCLAGLRASVAGTRTKPV